MENAFYVGINLQNVLYGLELVFYFKTMQIFLGRRREPHGSDAFFATFSTIMFLLATSWIITDAVIGADIWLLDRNYPGGPLAYLTGPSSEWHSHYQAGATIVMQQMTDGLMVYRCWIVWNSHCVTVVPSILWCVNLVLGILGAVTQGTDPYTGISVLFVLVYYVISVFLSAFLTCMICYRLMRHAKEVKECLGEEFASPYFAITVLLVESVLPYTLSGVVFLLSFGAGGQSGMAFARVYTLMTCVSPQMLILRVAKGNAWQKDTIRAPISAIMFSPSLGDTSGSRSIRFDGGGAIVKPQETLPSVFDPESIIEHSDKA